MPELSLVTYNAHAGMLPRPIALPRLWSLQRRSPGRFDLAAVLAGFDADIIVVQESFRPDHGPCAAEEAAQAMGAQLHEAPFGRAVLEPWPHLVRDQPGEGTKGLAVLTRVPAQRVADLPVSRVPLDPSGHRRALHLEVDVAGQAVDVFAVHLTSRLPHGPPLQLARLRSRLPGRGRPAVVTGDLNFWGPPVVALLPGWRRAVRGRTWPAHRPHSQIDHVLVRAGLQVVEAAVLPANGSDHRPVRVVLRVG